MNKKMLLSVVFLVSNLFNTAVALNEEQREILYTLNDLGQDFGSVPMITENIDMFIGMLQMNMQITEKKLEKANDETKKALWSGAAAIVGTALLRGLTHATMTDLLPGGLSKGFIGALLVISGSSVPQHIATFISTYSVLATYDAFKARSALEKALTVDKKILRKLEALKDSLPQQPAEQQA